MKKHVLVIALILIAALATPLFAQGAAETAAAGFVPSKDIEWFVTSSPVAAATSTPVSSPTS